MKARKAMKLLRVTRPTLSRYVKDGIIKVKVLPSGRYEYDDESIYNFIGKKKERKTVIYANKNFADNRIGSDTESSFDDRVKQVTEWSIKNGFKIDMMLADPDKIDNEKSLLFDLIEMVLSYDVKTVICLDFLDINYQICEIVKFLFSKFGTDFIIINSSGVAS